MKTHMQPWLHRPLPPCNKFSWSASLVRICERLNTLEDYVQLTGKEVTELVSKFECQTVTDGKIIIPAKVVKNIQALCFWAYEWTCTGHQLDTNEFTPVTLTETKETMGLQDESQPEPLSIKPENSTPTTGLNGRNTP